MTWQAEPRSPQALWRALQKLQLPRLDDASQKMLHAVAKTLAELAGVSYSAILRRLTPHTPPDIAQLETLYRRINDVPSAELRSAAGFCTRFLNFTLTSYQLPIVADEAPRITIRGSRQGGKTAAIDAKILCHCILHPGSSVIITGPGQRVADVVCLKLTEHYYRMDPVARRAWVKEKLQRIWRFRNGSLIKALPNALHANRGDTASLIFVDEAGFIRNDETVFTSILEPMLASTDGPLIISSTPWGKESYFYRSWFGQGFAERWSQHHFTWEQAHQAGIIKDSFVHDTILPLKERDPSRYLREYLAEFVEDADAWLPQDLIARCQDPALEEYRPFDTACTGRELYVGVDLGKKQDYSVIAVFEKAVDTLRLVHLKVFDLETPYAAVIGYLKILSERWQRIYRVSVDQTGVGEYVVEDMRNAGIPNLEGLMLSMPVKEQVLGFLRQQMREGRVQFPYDPALITELNIEKHELTKDGHVRFSHPENTHDDRLFAVALGVWAGRTPHGLFAVKGMGKIL